MLEHHRICDVNEVRCTYNQDTRVEIWVREQQSILYLTAQINCESPLQANEVVHQIKSFASPGKYIQLFPFSSFQQIPSHFFDPTYNNPDLHTIDNLYMRSDSEAGGTQYFFRMHYRPILRFNSVSADISDSAARSFPVVCDISYLIQLPMWMFDSLADTRVSRINLGLSASDTPGAIVADNNFMSGGEPPVEINGVRYSVGRRYVVDPDSAAYQSERITIPKPKWEYLLLISKLYPKKSTVVSLSGSYRGLPAQISDPTDLRAWVGGKDLQTIPLDPSDWVEEENPTTSQQQIVLFVCDRPHLQPEYDSPLLISLLRPLSSVEQTKQQQMKNAFSGPFEIRRQKNWRK